MQECNQNEKEKKIENDSPSYNQTLLLIHSILIMFRLFPMRIILLELFRSVAQFAAKLVAILFFLLFFFFFWLPFDFPSIFRLIKNSFEQSK